MPAKVGPGKSDREGSKVRPGKKKVTTLTDPGSVASKTEAPADDGWFFRSNQAIQVLFPSGWVLMIGLLLLTFASLQGICEASLMGLLLHQDDNSNNNPYSVPSTANIALAYFFVFNALLILLTWYVSQNIFMLAFTFGVNLIGLILSIWLEEYSVDPLDQIVTSYRNFSASGYSERILSNWLRTSGTSPSLYTFPDWRWLLLNCLSSGAAWWVLVLLCFSCLTYFCLVLNLTPLKDIVSASKGASHPFKEGPEEEEDHFLVEVALQRKRTRQLRTESPVFGALGVALGLFGTFVNFSTVAIRNLKIYPDSSSAYYLGTVGQAVLQPRKAMFFGTVPAAILYLLCAMRPRYRLARSGLVFLALIASLVSLGTTVYSAAAFGYLYTGRTDQFVVEAADIASCGGHVSVSGQDLFCVYNCTRSRVRQCQDVCIPQFRRCDGVVDLFNNRSLGGAAGFLLLACRNKPDQKELFFPDETYCNEDSTWMGLVVTNIVLATLSAVGSAFMTFFSAASISRQLKPF